MGLKKIKINFKLSRQILLAVLIITLAALAVFVLWPRYKVQTNRTQVVNSYGYTYTELDSYTLNGLTSGTGASFDKPKEFQSTLSSTNAPIADLAHSFGTSHLVIADMVVSGLPPAVPVTQGSASDYTKILADPSNSKYASTLKPLEQLVTQRLPSLNIKFGNAQPLTTPNLNGNAWKIDFTSTPKAGQNTAAFPLKQGVAILIMGKNTNYYAFIDALNKNWANNQSAWQKVINSLRVDQ